MNPYYTRLLSTAFIFLFLFAPIALNSITLKLASPLPEGTKWHNFLLKISGEWRTITDDQVILRLYPGGIAGDEGDMVRKMHFGQLDAGLFTAFGLMSMVPETFVVTLPGRIQTEEEQAYILSNWLHRFDEQFREEGFEMVSWSKFGWASLFGQIPLKRPSDLQQQILAVDNRQSKIGEIFKTLQFQVVPIAITEALVALQSGLVTSFYAPPVVAAFQWFALAPYMTDYDIAPVLGGFVFSLRSWEKIPGEFRSSIKTSIENMLRQSYTALRQFNEEALRIMEQNGLKRISLSDEDIAQWKRRCKVAIL